MSCSGISWAICKSAPRSRQITMPASHHSVFYRPDALPAAQPTASKHWRVCVCITQPTQQLQTVSIQSIDISSRAGTDLIFYSINLKILTWINRLVLNSCCSQSERPWKLQNSSSASADYTWPWHKSRVISHIQGGPKKLYIFQHTILWNRSR